MIMDFTTTACCSVELLERTYASFSTHLKGIDLKECTLYINIDPVPSTRTQEIPIMIDTARKYFGAVHVNTPKEPSFPNAVKWCWENTTEPYVLHLEYDWELREDISMKDIVELMDKFYLVNFQCYGWTGLGTKPGLLPGVWRGDTCRKLAKEMTGTIDPECQVRFLMSKTQEQKWNHPQDHKVIWDIGRDWRKLCNCEKNTGGNNYFTKWVERERAGTMLSILVCSLSNRARLLERLMERLNPQLVEQSVEVLVNTDRGQKTIGQKRNELLDRAVGRYVAFVDDDDLVATNYVLLILNALKATPTATHTELWGIMTTNYVRPMKFHHSTIHSEWFTKDGIYARMPNHLNAIRRDIALKIGFPELNVGEDAQFSTNLRDSKLLTTEAAIPEILYHYEWVYKHKENK